MSVRLVDGTVSLSARECGLLVFAEAEIVARWRRDGIDPPDLAVVLSMLREVAAEARLARSARPNPFLVPKVARAGSVSAESVLTVREAAEYLHISERAVTKATLKGHLVGRKVASDGRWEISADSVGRYVARGSVQTGDGEQMSDAEFREFVAEILGLLVRLDDLEAAVQEFAGVS